MNPYRQWLGLPSRPRDYYELLGVDPEQAEPEVVRAAAESALGRLRKVLAAHADRPEVVRQVHQLAGQIKKAAACLGESRARSEYDASRRGQRSDVPAAPGIEPVVPRLAQTRRRRSAWPQRAVYLLALLCFVILLAVFVRMVNQYAAPDGRLHASSGVHPPQSAADLPLPVLEPSAARTRSGPAPHPGDGVDDHAPPPPAPTVPTPVTTVQSTSDAPPADGDDDVAEVAAMIDAMGGDVETPLPQGDPDLDEEAIVMRLRSVWLLLQTGDTEEAQRTLAALATLEMSEPWSSAVGRLNQLTDLVAKFWQAFDAGCRQAVGTELTINARPMFIVEAAGDQFVIRDQGRNLRYARQELPTEIVLAIAACSLQPNMPTTQVLRGAFLATGSSGADERVLREWRAAQDAGATIDGLDGVLEDRRALFAR